MTATPAVSPLPSLEPNGAWVYGTFEGTCGLTQPFKQDGRGGVGAAGARLIRHRVTKQRSWRSRPEASSANEYVAVAQRLERNVIPGCEIHNAHDCSRFMMLGFVVRNEDEVDQAQAIPNRILFIP
jgi:hypothetical protein